MGLLYRIGRACVISGVLVAGSGTVCWYADLLSNPWCSSFRIVRFGRATNAVSCIYFVCNGIRVGSCIVLATIHLLRGMVHSKNQS